MASPPPDPPILPARYQIWPDPQRALLGRGGASEVWRVQDTELGILVALKVLRTEGARLAGRLEREAIVSASVVHPNVISLHDMGRTPDGRPYLAFALASDGSLLDHAAFPPAWPQLKELLIGLLDALAIERAVFVGTSMGGLIGMLIAAQPGAPITRLVLNDVGPLITAQSLGRIAQYVGNAPRFASVDEAEGYVRMVSAPFGKLSDGQWRHLTVHALRALPDGGYRMAYDPAIAVPFREAMVRSGEDFDLWPLYDAIRVPTLLLRGEHSDLLTHATALEMTRRGPRAELAEIAGVGHAPMLLDEAQIAPVRRFLIGR